MTPWGGYCIDIFLALMKGGGTLGPLKGIGYFLDCTLDLYLNKVVSGPFNSGVVLQIKFLSHYIKRQGNWRSSGCRSSLSGNQIIYITIDNPMDLALSFHFPEHLLDGYPVFEILLHVSDAYPMLCVLQCYVPYYSVR